MRFRTLALTSALVLGVSAGGAFAQDEPGFGGHSSVSKNQTPGPVPSGNATDPAAGNPGSPAQTPTDPVKQQELQYKGASGAGPGETGSEVPPSPPPQ